MEQLSHSGYDWLLVDTQHGAMDRQVRTARSDHGSNEVQRRGGAKRDGLLYASNFSSSESDTPVL
jgi:hypothetical protein